MQPPQQTKLQTLQNRKEVVVVICECGNDLKVMQTRSDVEATYRRHKCKVCGKVYYSIEFIVEADEQYFKEWKEASRTHKTFS